MRFSNEIIKFFQKVSRFFKIHMDFLNNRATFLRLPAILSEYSLRLLFRSMFSGMSAFLGILSGERIRNKRFSLIFNLFQLLGRITQDSFVSPSWGINTDSIWKIPLNSLWSLEIKRESSIPKTWSLRECRYFWTVLFLFTTLIVYLLKWDYLVDRVWISDVLSMLECIRKHVGLPCADSPICFHF